MNYRVIIEGDYDGITLSSLASMLCGVGVFPFGIGGGGGWEPGTILMTPRR